MGVQAKEGFLWLMAEFCHFGETSTLKSKGFSQQPEIYYIPENNVSGLGFSEALEASQWAEFLAHCGCVNKSIFQVQNKCHLGVWPRNPADRW